jgi:hypothetical protein
MTSKPLINNMKLFKKRDSSVDHQLQSRVAIRNAAVKPQNLGQGPKISANAPVTNVGLLPHIADKKKYLQTKKNIFEAIPKSSHSRLGSIDFSQGSTKPSSLFSSIETVEPISPKEKAQQTLISDYGKSIDAYLKSLIKANPISENHLSGHKINGVYRAKMVDWMTEVLTAFKCSDQTFFVAINLLDRYFDSLNKESICLELHDLHTTGVVCMFIASKYEDVYPLLMKTVFNKIGHSKISIETILLKEMEILRAIGFTVGASPTPLEFLETYNETVLGKHEDRHFIKLMSIYLAKMALHHEGLCTKQASLIGTSSIYVALKICE